MQHKSLIMLLAILMGVLLWFADGFLDYALFYEGQGTLLELLFTRAPRHELYIRSLILACFLGFGLVVCAIVGRLEKSRRAMRESEAWFSTTLKSIGDAVIATDHQGRIAFLNQAAVDVTGWSEAEARGRQCSEVFHIIHEETREKAVDPVTRVIAEGKVVGLANHTALITKDGREVPIEDSGAPIVGDAGFVGVVLVFHDIVERKEAQNQREVFQKQLGQAQKMEALGTLAGGIAHDFNNILAAITGFAELALDQANRGLPCQGDLQQILAGANRAANLVRQILTFSRKVDVDLKPMDLNQEVTKAVSLLRNTIPRMVEIDLELSSEIGPLRGDATQIQQIVLNLGSNAKDAMPDGGRLLFRTRPVNPRGEPCDLCHDKFSGPYYLLSVSDTGTGMDQATLEKIFDPFFTTKEVGKGTGLGLAAAFGIISAHGAHARVKSSPGAGTTFDIYFPLPGGSPTLEKEAERVENTLPGGGETILLVDDEPNVLKVDGRFLESAGYRVLLAKTGEEALEIYRAGRSGINMVILDMNMPGMGGRKALDALLQLDQRARVVLSSGYAEEADIAEALAAGAMDVIMKPHAKADLLNRTRKVLDI